MSHDHGQPATAAAGQRDRLKLVLAITLVILAAEVVGGVLAHSLVLIADAGHVATDAAGIGLSLLAVHFASRPASDARTFGYLRAEILAAVTNAVLLFGLGAFILVEAVVRLVHPETATPSLMVVFGLVALAGNAASLLLLRAGPGPEPQCPGCFSGGPGRHVGRGGGIGGGGGHSGNGVPASRLHRCHRHRRC